MHPCTKFARLVATIALVTLAIAARDRAAGRAPRLAIGLDRLAFGLDPCPLATAIATNEIRFFVAEGGYLLDATLIAPPRPESGFECPINGTILAPAIASLV